MSSPPVWLITGASSGLGLEIALAAKAANANVVATVRSRTKSSAAVSKLESTGCSIIELDVSRDRATIQAAVKSVETAHGRVDVLVNNAGLSVLGALEDFNEQDVQLQWTTNVFGPLWLTQAVLPGMRQRKSGTIVNIGSVAGFDGMPSCSIYAGTKFALEGMTEALSGEVAPFNIRALMVEPGAFRTNFLGAYAPNFTGLGEAYKGGPVDEKLQMFNKYHEKQPGDPVKAAKAIVQVVNAGCEVNGERVMRLPLGKDCVGRVEEKINGVKRNVDIVRSIAESTGYE